MFENTRIRTEIVKPYLRLISVDAMAQYPLPNVDNLMIPRDWQQRVEQVMVDQGYKD